MQCSLLTCQNGEVLDDGNHDCLCPSDLQHYVEHLTYWLPKCSGWPTVSLRSSNSLKVERWGQRLKCKPEGSSLGRTSMIAFQFIRVHRSGYLGSTVAWVICCLEWNTPKLSGLKQHTQLYYVLWLGLAGWFFSQSSSGPLPCLQTDGTGGSRSLSRLCRQMGLEALGASPVFVDRWDWRLSGPLPCVQTDGTGGSRGPSPSLGPLSAVPWGLFLWFVQQDDSGPLRRPK